MELEYEETPEMLQQKLAAMRKLVREAKHLVVYTGKNISKYFLPDIRRISSYLDAEIVYSHAIV